MRQEWVVVVEGVCTPAAFDLSSLRRLLQAVGDCHPVALHSSDRCALQLRVYADSSSEAVAVAVARWEAAVDNVRYLDWDVVRAEVMTIGEFDKDCDTAYGGVDASRPATAQGGASALRVGEELLRRAFEDPLTGMETSAAFAYRLEQASAVAAETATTCAVVVVALDDFQALNEQRGTEVGDQLVAAVAERLREVLAGGEKAARVGGDRFAVLLERTWGNSAVSIAGRLLDALRQPFHLPTGEISVSATAGLALGRGGDATSLMDNATAALLAAKASSHGGLRVFDRRSERHQPGPDEVTGPTSALDGSLLLLRRAATAAAESPTLEDAAAILLPAICTYAGWPMAQLCVFDALTGLTPAGFWCSTRPERYSAVQEAIAASPSPWRADLYRRVIRSRRPGWTVLHDEDAAADELAAAGLHAVVVVPLLAGTEVVGAFQFFADGPDAPDASVIETVALVGILLGPVARRAGGAAASDTEAVLHAIARRSGDLTIVVDGDLISRVHHPALGGGDDGEHQRLGITRFVHPDDLPEVRVRIGEAATTHTPQVPFECRMLTSGGSWHRMSIVATNLLDNPGVAGILLTARPVRERGTWWSGSLKPASVPFRYELFGWEPDQPAPALDVFIPRGAAGMAGGRDLREALTLTYERLAGSVADRSSGPAEDRHGPR